HRRDVHSVPTRRPSDLGLRVAGPVAVGLFGVVLLLAGRAGLGGMLISGALAWYMNAQRVKAARPTPGRRSTVRSAALEMELDHEDRKSTRLNSSHVKIS